MSLRDEILRHQLLLMRLVRTQSNNTKKYLKEAQDRIVKAIEDRKYIGLKKDVKVILDKIPKVSTILLEELATYEANFTNKKIKQFVGREAKDKVTPDVQKVKISTSVNKKPETINRVYQSFANTKLEQYTQIVKDGRTLKKTAKELIKDIQERTTGLFFTQNEVLAQLGVVGVANAVRAEIAKRNGMMVDWVLDLELNNCAYCIEQADGSPYNPEDIEGLIPAHGRCGCTTVPVETL